MAELTPTTEQVREAALYWAVTRGRGFDLGRGEAEAEFDRWLASIESAAERRGAVKALREAVNLMVAGGMGERSPYRFLTDMHAEFESGERDLP